MGWFIDFHWGDGVWVASEDRGELPPVAPAVAELWISIYDSDVATITFRLRGHSRAAGEFYLGEDPATYFADEVHYAVDHRQEAKAFARWVRGATGRKIRASDVVELMARPGYEPPVEVHDDVDRLLALVGIPRPAAGPWGDGRS